MFYSFLLLNLVIIHEPYQLCKYINREHPSYYLKSLTLIKSHSMKSNVCFLILILFLVSCSSPEGKARNAIKEKLKMTLNNFKSYESVKFGTLDSLFSDVTTSSEYEALKTKRESWIKLAEEEKKADEEKIQTALKNGNPHHIPIIKEFSLMPRCLDSAEAYLNKLKSVEKSYKPRFIGWSMTHLYRAKNLAGNYKLNNESFYFDKELSKVVGTIDMLEE